MHDRRGAGVGGRRRRGVRRHECGCAGTRADQRAGFRLERFSKAVVRHQRPFGVCGDPQDRRAGQAVGLAHVLSRLYAGGGPGPRPPGLAYRLHRGAGFARSGFRAGFDGPILCAGPDAMGSGRKNGAGAVQPRRFARVSLRDAASGARGVHLWRRASDGFQELAAPLVAGQGRAMAKRVAGLWF